MPNQKIISILFTTIFFASAAACQTDLDYIPASKYFDTAISEITSAKSSIQVFMYLISAFPDQPDSQPNQLLNALIQAKNRGVSVRVILDQNIDFQEETRDEAIYQNKNQKAYELLKQNNIPVFFDEADTYTHAKAIVIDNETVILGSTNWSKAALTQNHEANALIRSKEFAENLLKDMVSIKVQENIPASVTPNVSIPKNFLSKEKLLGEMVSQSDDRAFDSYLYILSQYDGNKDRKITLNYDKLADSLGIGYMTKEDYRRQINKVLDKLDHKYRLIEFKNPERNHDAEITLKEPKTEESFPLSTSYWRYGWNKSLSFPAKVMYLIILSYTSHTSPDFFMSRDTLSEKHHISKSFITDGTRELTRLNLLQVKYGELEGKSYNERDANVYTPKVLYDPEDLKKDLKKLEEKYGQEKLVRAKQTAALVFEENNPKTIEAVIELENQYGRALVEDASNKISEKNPDNPKRSAGYLINTVKSMSRQKEVVV